MENSKDHRLNMRLEEIQYQYFNGRPEWTTIKPRDLNLYIAYTYLGSPFESENEIEEDSFDHQSSELFSYYSSEKQKQIKIIVDNITTKIVKSQFDEIEIGITLVHSICQDACEICHNFPDEDIHLWTILRIRVNKTKFFYYDASFGRMYKNWRDFLKNNTLPKGYMFYPQSGFYSEADYLTKELTPRSRPSAKLLNSFDVVGKVTSFTSGVLLAGSLFIPVMAPITLPAAAVASSLSAWDVGRQISNLIDRSSHSQSLTNAEARKCWLDLTISTMGVMTAPLSAGVKSLELSGSSLLASKFGKTLRVLRTGTCITQCSLSIVGLTSDLVDEISMKKLLFSILTYLRLDVFLVTGVLFAMPVIRKIMESVSGCTLPPKELIKQDIFSENIIPYFIVQKYFNNCLIYTKKRINSFYESIEKFLKNNLTFEKLMMAFKDFLQLYEDYKKKMDSFSMEECLNYVINHMDLDFLTLKEKEEAILVLSGENMKELLLCVPKENLNQKMIIFVAKQVVSKANDLAKNLTDVVQTCMLYSETNYEEITKSFCLEYNLKECCLKEYLLNGIKTLKENISNLLIDFSKYERVNSEDFKIDTEGFTSKCKLYQIIAPHNTLNIDVCKSISQTIAPRQDSYNNFQFKTIDGNSCLLFMNTQYCRKTVFFNICANENSDLPNQLHIYLLNLQYF